MKNVYVFILIIFCSLSAVNKTMAQSGTTGSCTWTLTGTSPNYTLIISGTGAMGDNISSNASWFSHRTNIKTVIIQQGVTHIGEQAFYNHPNIASLTIDNSVTSIGKNAFYGCSGLTSLTIPNSVTSIGNQAFNGCYGLTSLTIPNSVTSIGEYAFYNCNGLTSLTISNSVTSIERYTFGNGSGLTSLTIPNSVTSILDGAFYGCSGLTSLTIGNSVTSMGRNVLTGCTNLTIMYVKAVNPPSTGAYAFSNVPSNIPVHVPCGSVSAYQNATNGTGTMSHGSWRYFTNYIGDVAFSITVNSANTAMGTAAVTQQPTCANSNTVIISATPKSGYVFSQWDDGNTQNPRSITLTSDLTRTAYFTFAPAATANMITISGNTPICQNTSITLTASASSVNNPTFRWYSNNTSSATLLHTGASYTTSNLTSTTTFYVSVSGDNYSENTAANRQSVTVNVTAPLTAGGSVKSSTSQVHCPSIHPSIALGSTVQGGSTYLWERSTDNRTFTSIGITTATYNIPANTLTQTTYYRRKVSNVCGGIYSDTAEITIRSLPVINAEKTTLCIGSTVRLIPDNSGVWTSNNSGIVEVINGTAIEGKSAGTATLSFTSSATGCTNTLPITVNPYLDPEEITGKKVVCEGQEIELSNTTPGGVWTKNNTNVSVISQTATPAKATIRGVTKGNSYVTYTVSNGECKTKRTFQLKVVPVSTTPPRIIIGIER